MLCVFDKIPNRATAGLGNAAGMCSTDTMLISRIPLLVLLLALCASAQVRFTEGEGQIAIEIDGKPFSTFYFGSDAPKPYLHPVRSAGGVIVTRGYPMENIPGENRDHAHHRGLWFSHGDVNGYDFWANEFTQKPRSKKGIVRVTEIRHTAGKSSGTISGTFEWAEPGGDVLLTEEREMVFHSGPGNRLVDFDLKLTAGSSAVKLGDTKEGTFAIRLATELEENRPEVTGIPRTGRILSATGKAGETQAWGKRAPWVDYSGSLRGKKLGVAIFDHPSNPKHPTHWHVRAYGLFAANIFGEHDFYQDPSRDAGVTLKAGKSLHFLYRVVIHPGDAKQANVPKLYEDYVKTTK